MYNTINYNLQLVCVHNASVAQCVILQELWHFHKYPATHFQLLKTTILAVFLKFTELNLDLQHIFTEKTILAFRALFILIPSTDINIIEKPISPFTALTWKIGPCYIYTSAVANGRRQKRTASQLCVLSKRSHSVCIYITVCFSCLEGILFVWLCTQNAALDVDMSFELWLSLKWSTWAVLLVNFWS